MTNLLAALSPTVPPKTNWTPEQLAVINSKSKAVLVRALSGTGKSQTLMGLAHKYKSGLYLSFTKTTVTDIIHKLPDNWSCSTFNALGLSIIRKNQSKAIVRFSKYSKKGRLKIPSQLAQKHMTLSGADTPDSWRKTCTRFNIQYKHVPLAREVLSKGLANNTVISGDDMLQYPIINKWKTEPYEILLIDEFQDLSPQQLDFIDCIPHKRIVLVGDENQSIYFFRGSDSEITNKIIQKYKPEVLSLTQSFRCPKEVLVEAKKYVPEIWSQISGGTVTKVKTKPVSSYPEDCFILCRVNSGLISVANSLIRENENFSISDNFVKLIKREIGLAISGCKTIAEAKQKTENRFSKTLDLYKKNKWSTSALINRNETVNTVFDSFSNFSEINKFLNKLSLSAINPSKRKLLTGHGCKGLENKNVFILNQEIGLKFASDAIEQGRFEEAEEELNIMYVMITRSLKNLAFVGG